MGDRPHAQAPIPSLSPAHLDGLRRHLTQAQARGAVGPGDTGDHIEHALALASALPHPPERFVDLGTGAGVPGLVWACLWEGSHAVLVESHHRRLQVVRAGIKALGLEDRVEALEGRAEELAHEERWRGWGDVVVARAFGPPATTAECAAGFLAMGGWLVVSEPPSSAGRWDEEGMARLGLGAPQVHRLTGASGMVAQKEMPTPPQFPRRTGRPRRDPLWGAPGSAGST